jgi:hypothetical protein
VAMLAVAGAEEQAAKLGALRPHELCRRGSRAARVDVLNQVGSLDGRRGASPCSPSGQGEGQVLCVSQRTRRSPSRMRV